MSTKIPVQNLEWLPGPAMGENAEFIFGDGDRYLMALTVGKDSQTPKSTSGLEYAVVTVLCDESYFALEVEGDPWGWDWPDVEWFASLESTAVNAHAELLAENCDLLAELAEKNREVERLRSDSEAWAAVRGCIHGNIEANPSFDHAWAGDKQGWGFCFEWINWMALRTAAAEAALASSSAQVGKLRMELQQLSDEWLTRAATDMGEEADLAVSACANELTAALTAGEPRQEGDAK